MNFSSFHRHRQAWAFALVLVMLWLGGWGQVHRVLHAGAAAVVQPEATEASWQASLQAGMASHEDGGGLCQLLDHLSHGAALGSAGGDLAVAPPPLGPAPAPVRTGRAVDPAVFEARGPPRLA